MENSDSKDLEQTAQTEEAAVEDSADAKELALGKD